MSYSSQNISNKKFVPEYRRESQLRYSLNKIGGKFGKKRNLVDLYFMKNQPRRGPYYIFFADGEILENISLSEAENLMLQKVKTTFLSWKNTVHKYNTIQTTQSLSSVD